MLETIFVSLFLIMFVFVIAISLLQRKFTNNYQNVQRSRHLFYAMITPVALWMLSGIVLIIFG